MATAAASLATSAASTIATWTPIAINVATGILKLKDIIQDIKSNPGKAKGDALKKCREESKEEHEKSVATMEALKKKFDEAAEKSQSEADRRFKEQQAVNAAAQEAIEKRIKESEEKYDENIRKMTAEHQKRMKEIRDESKEEREQAMNEHKKKMADLEKKHDKERQEANQKLEETKKEGARQIEKASDEIRAVAEARAACLKSFEEEMRKLMAANHEKLMLLNKEALEMRMENSRLRLEHLKEENKTMLRQIDQRTDELLTHFKIQHSREVIVKFKGVVEKVTETSNSLQHVETECIKAADVNPGDLDPDFQAITEGKALYQDRVKRYRQFAINATHADPRVLNICSQFINDMNKVMEDRALLQITTHLPRAIDQNNTENIENYGKMARLICEKFKILDYKVQNQFDGITENFNETKSIAN